jgi:hypothetical protein
MGSPRDQQQAEERSRAQAVRDKARACGVESVMAAVDAIGIVDGDAMVGRERRQSSFGFFDDGGLIEFLVQIDCSGTDLDCGEMG